MMRLLTRPGDGLGFRLAGAAVVEIAPGDEGARLRALLDDPAVTVLVIEEEVLAAAPEAARRAAERGRVVILPFALPRRWGETGQGRDYVAALIRRAVGYHIKIGAEGGP